MNEVSFKSGSKLERVLKAGQFAVTGELGPPRGANKEVVTKKAGYLRGIVDAVNITDNQTGVVRMASWATCLLAIQEGLEPNYQMVCRDRNRIAMQSDLLGVYAHGIRNMLCLSGDHQQFGDHPLTKGVFDIDSIQLISVVKKMRDEGKFMNDVEIDEPPKIFIGAAANPFAEPFEWRVHRLAKKIAAGADFIQTQCVYDMKRFREWIRQANDMGLTEKVHILAGLTPLKSGGMARYMAKNVSGIIIPEEIIDRVVKAPKASEEGIKICVEQIEEMKGIKGVHGVHIMAIEWEQKVAEIAERAKLLPRPQGV
jgi:methylenetetrahydrofolate reductase (NADPH)